MPLTVLPKEALVLATTEPEKYYNPVEPDEARFKAYGFPETIMTDFTATCQPNTDSLNPFTPAAQARLLSSLTDHSSLSASRSSWEGTAGLLQSKVGFACGYLWGQRHQPWRAWCMPSCLVVPVDECFSNYCLTRSDCTNAAGPYIPPAKIT